MIFVFHVSLIHNYIILNQLKYFRNALTFKISQIHGIRHILKLNVDRLSGRQTADVRNVETVFHTTVLGRLRCAVIRASVR